MRWFALVALVAAAGAARADMSLPGANARAGGGGDCGAALEAARKRAAAIEPRFQRARITHDGPASWELLVQDHGGLYFSVSVFPFREASLGFRQWTTYDGAEDTDTDVFAVLDRAALARRAAIAATGWGERVRTLHAIFKPAAEECLR